MPPSLLAARRTSVGRAYVYNVQSGVAVLEEVASLMVSGGAAAASGDGGTDYIQCLRFNPCSDLLAAGFSCGVIRVYALQRSSRTDKGTIIFTSRVHDVSVRAAGLRVLHPHLCAPPLQSAGVTCCVWDGTGSSLYAGDASGRVSESKDIPRPRAGALSGLLQAARAMGGREAASSLVLFTEPSAIVQVALAPRLRVSVGARASVLSVRAAVGCWLRVRSPHLACVQRYPLRPGKAWCGACRRADPGAHCPH